MVELSAPGPQILPAVVPEWAKCPGPYWPSGSSGSQGPAPTDCDPGRWPLPLDHRGRDMEEVHLHLKPVAQQPWQEFWNPAGHSPQPFLWAPQLTHWPKPRWAGGPLGEGQDPPLTSLSTWGPPRWWLWMGPLTLAHWQLFAWGRGPLQHHPMAV